MGKFLAFILLVALCVLFVYWRFNAVIGSDLPDWLKYILLSR